MTDTTIESSPVTAADVGAARERIAPYVRHTPLEQSPALSHALGAEVYLKLECWQVTGSFKPRVSLSRLLAMDASARERGVVASTAGGHGIGLSHASRVLGVPARIYLPRAADARKVRAIAANGAELSFLSSVSEARAAARADAMHTGATFVSAYNDPHVVAGGGTVALEILDDLPDVDLLVAPVGGGGIISGMGVALHAARPGARVWGVMPEVNPVLARWMEAGRPVAVDGRPSIADGLGASIEDDSITFPLARRHVERMLLVSEDAIADAMAWLLFEHGIYVEPSGAATVAALRDVTLPPDARRVAVLISGRNVSTERWTSLAGARLAALSSNQ